MKLFSCFLYTMLILCIYSCTCKCSHLELNTVYFKFKIGAGPGSFTDQEVDTIIVYRLVKNTNTKVDSVIIYDKSFSLNESESYFKSTSFWDNDYRIKTQTSKDFLISEIQIESAEEKNRCKCFVNTSKKFKVNGMAFDLSGKPWNESNVELTK